MHICADTAQSLDKAEIESVAETSAHAHTVVESMVSPELKSFMESLSLHSHSTSDPPVTTVATTGSNFISNEHDADTALSVLALQRQVALAHIDAATDKFIRAKEEINRGMFSM